MKYIKLIEKNKRTLLSSIIIGVFYMFLWYFLGYFNEKFIAVDENLYINSNNQNLTLLKI